MRRAVSCAGSVTRCAVSQSTFAEPRIARLKTGKFAFELKRRKELTGLTAVDFVHKAGLE
jgi:hypothetical protein